MFRRHRPQPIATVPDRPPGWGGLFVGATERGPVTAGAEGTVLVLGPPRSGKTTSVVIPNVLAAPGAVVATSTKTDVLAVTAHHRAHRGRVWQFDPSGALPVTAGLTPLRWSPVGGCADWATAVRRAHALAGAARPARGITDAHHWTERAEALLATHLHAGALAGLDIGWPLRWVLRHDTSEPLGLIARLGGHELATEVLVGIANTESRERSGIFSTTAGVLAAYRDPATLAAAAKPNFDPEGFVYSSDTVYICAPAAAQDQLAPLVVALLDEIRHHAYRRPPGSVPLLWVLDEVANIAPLPNLPAVVSEGGGQGLVTLACLQDLSQARARWGVAAEGFLSLFSTKLALPGIADLATLKLISSLAGEHDVNVRSTSKGPPRGWFDMVTGRGPMTTTFSTQRRPILPVETVSRGHPGCALAIPTPHPPEWIRLTPWWTWPWNEVLQLRQPELSEVSS